MSGRLRGSKQTTRGSREGPRPRAHEAAIGASLGPDGLWVSYPQNITDLVSMKTKGLVRVVNVETENGQEFAHRDEHVRMTAVSSEGRFVAACGDTGISLWDATSRSRIQTLEHSGFANDACFSPDGTLLAVAYGYSFEHLSRK